MVNNQRKELVYFILGKATERLKIGKTYNTSARKRLAQLQSENADDLILVGITDQYSELQMHAKFEKSRHHNEWFTPTQDLVDFVKSLNGVDLSNFQLQIPKLSGRAKQRNMQTQLPKVDTKALAQLMSNLHL